MSARVIVDCDTDGCTESSGDYYWPSAADCRRDLRKAGWQCTKSGDRCPAHRTDAGRRLIDLDVSELFGDDDPDTITRGPSGLSGGPV